MNMWKNVDKLIPELAEWNNGDGISLDSWISCIGRYDLALGYGSFFWPDFFLHDDCIFHHSPDQKHYQFFMKIYQDWMNSMKGNKTKVEAMINHLHIADIFHNSDFKPTKEIVICLGNILKDIWSCKLRRDFPERRIEVKFYTVNCVQLLDYEITFYQLRD